MRRVELDKGNESAVGGDSRVKCVKAVGGRTSIHANDHHPRYRSSDVTHDDNPILVSSDLLDVRDLRRKLYVLFTLGALGVLIRRNPLVVFMCIELMLNAVNLALVGYSSYLNSEEGQVFAFMVIVVAAAEVVVGLGLLTRVFSIGRELDVDDLDEMKQ